MEKEKKEPASIRGPRGLRGSRVLPNVKRDRPEENILPPKSIHPSKESTKLEQTVPSREDRNPETSSRIRRRGQNNHISRRNRRLRQPMKNTKRLERAQIAARNQPKGRRGEFKPRRRFFGIKRRTFGRRSIFIAGLPRNINRYRLTGLIKKEGRVLRCTLLRDRYGNSRGIAFAEMKNPRDAWKIIQKWRGKKVGGNTIFVTFKREPNRYRNNYSKFNNMNGNNRQFNNYRGYYFNYQRTNRQRGNRIKGRGRGY